MVDESLPKIEVSRLRIGMYVHLDVGWKQHPFPFNSFMLRSEEQIDILRSLGLAKVRYSPRRSDVEPLPEVGIKAESKPGSASPVAESLHAPSGESTQTEASDDLRGRLARQQDRLYRCETRFLQASRQFRKLQQRLRRDPDAAREDAEQVIEQMAAEVEGDHEVTIRLLSERVGEESSTHAINVSVLSLLLAKACGLGELARREVGLGALLHDIGKLDLPGYLQWSGAHLSEYEQRATERHVELGVEAGRRMGLPAGALRAIAEHHERSDGNGFPQALQGEDISPMGRIVALVNHFENLVNPGNADQRHTPHEAMAMIYATQKSGFDARTLGLFVRMMGVYPPGSIVELVDGRLVLVVSATPEAPLRPRVVVLNGASDIDETLLLDLNTEPELGIRKSLRPEQVPRDALAHLALRRRSCYYFEPLDDVDEQTRPES